MTVQMQVVVTAKGQLEALNFNSYLRKMLCKYRNVIALLDSNPKILKSFPLLSQTEELQNTAYMLIVAQNFKLIILSRD